MNSGEQVEVVGDENSGTMTGNKQKIKYKGREIQELAVNDKRRNMLTVLHTVHHHLAGEQPRSVQLSYNKSLTVEQEVYSRGQLATEDWQSIDFGWFEPSEVGFIVVENLEGKHFQVNPTEHELEQLNKRVIELTHRGQEELPWPIPPKESFVAATEHADKLILRCRNKQAKFRLTLYPK
jgi:hypothetical protein